MSKRIVVTGIGVVSPNATGRFAFKEAIASGSSGIAFQPELEKLKFKCQVGGIPQLTQQDIATFTQRYKLGAIKSTGILYGVMAAVEAWEDAGIPVDCLNPAAQPDYKSGCVFGTGSNGIEVLDDAIRLVDSKQTDQIDHQYALQSMNSCVSSYIGRLFGLGNWVTTNSSACNTGTEALLDGYNRIKMGKAERMVVGSCESNSPYVWGPFDSLFALTRTSNHAPEQASCPMSDAAAGFVPSSGAGALILESLDTALARGANIYAEVLGGHINSGGQRGDGTMTIGNGSGMVKCIQEAMRSSGITAEDIDLIAGHLSSTIGDITEIKSWCNALQLKRENFPHINSMKSMIGHCLSASGSIESVATILQLHHGFIHPTLNVENLHPEIATLISKSSVPEKTLFKPLRIAAKISLGFGDVNSCVIFKKWTNTKK